MTGEPSPARELLLELCDDILDLQIGTLMFWSEEDLRRDGFAQYVHHVLQQASRRMGWNHYDSSHIWEAKP